MRIREALIDFYAEMPSTSGDFALYRNSSDDGIEATRQEHMEKLTEIENKIGGAMLRFVRRMSENS
jgi:hypothetical protein